VTKAMDQKGRLAGRRLGASHTKVDSRIGIVAHMHAISTWLRLFRLSSTPGPCSVHERWGASRNYYCHRAIRSLGIVADLTSEQRDVSVIHEGMCARFDVMRSSPRNLLCWRQSAKVIQPRVMAEEAARCKTSTWPGRDAMLFAAKML
jgi:hypothetical protein